MLCALLCVNTTKAQVYRPLDGYANNQTKPHWGAATTPFLRPTGNGFSDSIATPAGINRPNPRTVSSAIGRQTQFTPNELGLSDFIWGWGQFIDHDINLNTDHPTEFLPIDVPIWDPDFDPLGHGNVQIPMRRSLYDPFSGTSTTDPRMHVNEITAYIDGSAIYGNDEIRLDWMRTFQDGKLKTSAGNLLPFNTVDGEHSSAHDPNAPFMAEDAMMSSDKLFVAGDIRANEQPGLTCFHILFVREHNRICDEIRTLHPNWPGEQIFQKARKKVGAILQSITYEEWLPAMGFQIPSNTGYDPTINPSITNVFSAAAYRFGHSMVNGRMVRFSEGGDSLLFGSVHLRDAYFNTDIIINEGGIDPFFRGMASQEHQFVDTKITDDMRNFLFGPPGAGGLDLLALNINRGRERGLVDFNAIRQQLGLSPLVSFSDLTSDPSLEIALANLYGDVNQIDPWIGFMAEDHPSGTIMGPTLQQLILEQFLDIRDGDRFYYENDAFFTPTEINEIKNTRLVDVIRRNTSIQAIQNDVFIAQPATTVAIELAPFKDIRNMELNAYPNPIQKHFRLKINAFRNSSATLSILDNSGRMVQSMEVNIVKGENLVSWELQDEIANGLYTIYLNAENDAGQLKIVKLKE